MTKTPSQSPLIRDIPSIRKNLETARTFKQMKAWMPLLRPFLTLLGVEVDQLDAALVNTDELIKASEELAAIPDRFNDLFSSRGWIIYDQMNIEVAKAAIAQSEAGDIDGAEQALVAYYSPETVKWLLRTMNGIQAFRPRMRLAQLAWVDYQEGRYHACIPVVLAMMDGLVNDLHQPKHGFFANGVNLEAWDSIAAHSKGLQALSGLLGKGRDKTREEPISIPYRNGILHGTDLGYDNQMVAAKAWAALFAVREWAAKAERGHLTAPPEAPQISFTEILKQIQETNEDKKWIANWQPRSLQIGVDIPISGEPVAFPEGTPEHRLVEYLTWWKKRNYGFMARYLPKKWGFSEKEAPARIREQFTSKLLESFGIISVTDEAPAITVIEVKLVYEVDGKEIEKNASVRMMNEDAKGDPAIFGKPDSNWIILTWAIV